MKKLILTTSFILFFFCNAFAQLENIKVGNSTRQMIVHKPANLPANSPLLISLHGMNQDAPYQKNQCKWEPVADSAKFLVVFPNGNNKSWDINGNADIDFISAVIDTMVNRNQINRSRVYVSGFSMGGMMSYHVANKMADKVAAIAPVSGYLFANPVSSSRPMPIIHTHGTTDDVVGYSGVAAILQKWRTHNSCPSSSKKISPYPTSKPASVASWEEWGPCDNSSVVLLSIAGKGHWHSLDEASVNTSVEIWNFVKNYSLTGVTPTEPPEPPIPSPRDTIYNGDFKLDVKGWALNVWAGEAQGKVVNGEYQLAVNSIGTDNYQIQLIQAGLVLKKDQSYEITFDAYAASPRNLELNMEQDVSPWASYIGEAKEFSLSTSKQKFSLQFTMNQATDSNSRISFNAGSSTGTLFLDNISIKPIETLSVPTLSQAVAPTVKVSVAQGAIQISYPLQNIGEVFVSLYDLNGNCVHKSLLHSSSQVIEMKNKALGIYLVRLQTSAKVLHTSLIRWSNK